MTYQYAGNGRLILIGLKKDIDMQLSTGYLMNSNEYPIWIKYLKDLSTDMERELHLINTFAQKEQNSHASTVKGATA